jgi:hypothetical protein
MSDKWMIRSNNYGNCNCATNCGCQFNLPSTHGHCQFAAAGHIEEGFFNDTDLADLNWFFAIVWPGEIAEGNGTEQVIIDERANPAQRDALAKIVRGEVGEPGSNHFSVFGSTCTEVQDTLFLPIEYEVDLVARTGSFKIPDVVESTGSPIINELDGSEFHIALARTAGSFEFTYCELGKGSSSMKGPMEFELTDSYAQFCETHYDQDGLVNAA